jgi:hypothetical protein
MLRRHLLMSLPAAALLAQDDETGFTPLKDWVEVDAPESAFTVAGDEITVYEHASFPAWLRSARQYENFDLRGEFFTPSGAWTDSGFYFHAPEHGRPSQAGFMFKVFHQLEKEPATNSVGAIFPVIAPRLTNVRKGWNDFRILCDYPTLKVWTNGELIHDLDMAHHPDLMLRLRKGYFGVAAASARCRFRKLRVRELAANDRPWTALYEEPADLERVWTVTEDKPNFKACGAVLRGDGSGHLATKEKYQDFEFQAYVRGCPQHNSGILFRYKLQGSGTDRYYEIQLHPVEESHYPTGSLYHLQRGRYPRIQDEKWFLLEIRIKGRTCRVRIDGETITESEALTRQEPGQIALQAHRAGYWIEFKHIRLRTL